MRLNQISSFKKLKEEPKDYWVKLMNKYIVDAKSVTVSINFEPFPPSDYIFYQGSHSTWKTWKSEGTPGKPGNIMEF